MTSSFRTFFRYSLPALLAMPVAAFAQTWDAGGGDTNWSTAANWSPDTVPTGTPNVTFGTGGTTATVDSARTVGLITFNRAGDFTINNSGGAALTITTGITSFVPGRTDRAYVISAPVILGGNVTFNVLPNGGNSGAITLSGGISETGGARNITKTGFGNVLLTGNSTHTGTTLINYGTLGLQNNIATLSSSAVTTSGGYNALLNIISTSTADDVAITRAASLTMNGGGLTTTGVAGFRTREVITGALTFGAGPNVVSVAANNRRAVLQAGSLEKSGPGGYALLRGSGLGATAANDTTGLTATSNIVFTTAPSASLFTGAGGLTSTAQRGILAWAVTDTSAGLNGSNFATYDVGTDGVGGTADDLGIRALNTSESANGFALAATGDNVRVGAADSLATSRSINSLLISNGGSLTVASGATLSISSGALLFTGASTTGISGAGTVDFGTATEAFITVNDATKTFSAGLAAGVTVYKYGTSTLDLSGVVTNGATTPTSFVIGQGQITFSNANSSFTGGVTVERGRLQVNGAAPEGANGALGNSNSAIVLGTSKSTQSEGIILGLGNGTVLGRDIEGRQTLVGNPDSQRYRIVVDSGTATISSSSTLVMGETATNNGRRFELVAGTGLGANNTALLDYQGLITQNGGVGTLLINGSGAGTGTVRLANSGNSYTVGTTVVNGTVRLAGTVGATGNSVIGTGSMGLGEGATPSGGNASGLPNNPPTLRLIMDGNFDFARAVSLNGAQNATVAAGLPTGYLTLVIGNDVAGASSTFSGGISSNTDAKVRTLQLLADGSAATTVTFSGVIGSNTDAVGVTNVEKTGVGRVVLSNISNAYDGTTTVSAGNLQVGNANLGQTGTAAVTVNGAGAVLSGTGFVRGFTTLSNGTIKAGDTGGSGVGNLRFTNGLTFAPGTSMLVGEFTVQSNPSLTSDKLTVTGNLALNAFSNFTVLPSLSDSTFAPTLGQTFTLVEWTGTLALNGFNVGPDFRNGASDTGTNLDLPDISASGYVWDISTLSDGATGPGALTITVAVPEPGRAVLLFAGLALMLTRRRRARVA